MTDTKALAEAIAAIRESKALGRSPLLRQLFDYLAQCSLEGRSPKEAEVAIEVFGRDPQFDPTQDSLVRVYVHKLRQRLDLAAPDQTQRLIIPRGEYRLVLREEAEQPAPIAPELPPAPAILPTRPKRAWRAMLGGLAPGLALGLALAGGVAWTLQYREGAQPVGQAARSAVWQAVIDNGKPVLIVLGDYYIFADMTKDGETRLVREFSVNSPTDLDAFRAAHPSRAAGYADLGLQYLPVGSANALMSVGSLLQGARDVRVTLASRLTPTMIRDVNIVYIGYFSALGVLRDATFAGSRYAIGETYDDIIDNRTQQHFQSGGGAPGHEGTMYPDFGYVSTFQGPTGNRFVIIAGTRDAALTQMGQSALSGPVLDKLGSAGGKSLSAEALFGVNSLNEVNIDSHLIQVSPLDQQAIWGQGNRTKTFPAG